MNHNLKSILVIDDQYLGFQEKLESSFSKDGCKLTFCSNKDDAIDILDTGNYFDAIILDWFLEPENDLLSKLVLLKIKQTKFIPIFIWSHHVSNFQDSYDRGEINYPNGMIQKLDKHEINPIAINEKINSWLKESVSAKLSYIYRYQIKKALEELFFELSEVHNVELSTFLRIIMGNGDNVDWSSDFILNLLHRKLLREEEFENDIRNLLLSLPSEDSKGEAASTNNIVNKILYFSSNSIYPRMGDIINFMFNTKSLCGIIINPDCDIEQGKSRYIEIVELLNIDDIRLNLKPEHKKEIKKGNHPSFYFFPSLQLNTGFANLVAIFKSKYTLEVIRDLRKVKYPDVESQKLSFKDSYLYNGEKVTLNLCCGLSDPYKSDFMNKLMSHNSRVGTPDVKKMWCV